MATGPSTITWPGCATRLFEAREQRARPGLDDKVLTEWNALMIGSLAEAGRLLGEPSWIELAVDAADFLLDRTPSPGWALASVVACRR